MNSGHGRGGDRWRAELPRRIAPRVPGVRTVSWGPLPEQVASARAWCRNGTRLGHDRAYPLMAVLSELHTNALRHSASGRPCGRVRMEMSESRGVFRVAVTDDGAPAGAPHSVPEVGGGFGLLLVERLAADWGWTGEPGHPLTVWALVDPRAPLPADEGEGYGLVSERAAEPARRAPEAPARRSGG
ncbi:ATP-binding protein [Nocardiopsis tropica]|uniref:ATP-binding protein n=1 Tax=Nocardiopsis tropica TaxID=109330 RepID=A0ABU7KJB5_9ACTN|nr:ATP-binding protein [Nocardiopsis umidischolae]MEE2049389.1 ATP-binding protein [Nocardiopsis umidischolae]